MPYLRDRNQARRNPRTFPSRTRCPHPVKNRTDVHADEDRKISGTPLTGCENSSPPCERRDPGEGEAFKEAKGMEAKTKWEWYYLMPLGLRKKERKHRNSSGGWRRHGGPSLCSTGDKEVKKRQTEAAFPSFSSTFPTSPSSPAEQTLGGPGGGKVGEPVVNLLFLVKM